MVFDYRKKAEELREEFHSFGAALCGILLLFTAGGTLVFAGLGLHMAVRELSFQMHRAESEGTISKTEVRRSGGGRNRPHYRPWVSVAFTHDGERYEAVQINRFGSGPTGSQEWAAEQLMLYHVGDRVTVFFNARNPNDASLHPQTPPWMYAPLYAAAGTVALGGYFASVARVRRFWSARAVAVVWFAVGALTTAHYLGVTGMRPASYAVLIAPMVLIVGAMVLWKSQGFARSPWESPITKWFLP
jgi:hypothetical protein